MRGCPRVFLLFSERVGEAFGLQDTKQVAQVHPSDFRHAALRCAESGWVSWTGLDWNGIKKSFENILNSHGGLSQGKTLTRPTTPLMAKRVTRRPAEQTARTARTARTVRRLYFAIYILAVAPRSTPNCVELCRYTGQTVTTTTTTTALFRCHNRCCRDRTLGRWSGRRSRTLGRGRRRWPSSSSCWMEGVDTGHTVTTTTTTTALFRCHNRCCRDRTLWRWSGRRSRTLGRWRRRWRSSSSCWMEGVDTGHTVTTTTTTTALFRCHNRCCRGRTLGRGRGRSPAR